MPFSFRGSNSWTHRQYFFVLLSILTENKSVITTVNESLKLRVSLRARWSVRSWRVRGPEIFWLSKQFRRIWSRSSSPEGCRSRPTRRRSPPALAELENIPDLQFQKVFSRAKNPELQIALQKTIMWNGILYCLISFLNILSTN